MLLGLIIISMHLSSDSQRNLDILISYNHDSRVISSSLRNVSGHDIVTVGDVENLNRDGGGFSYIVEDSDGKDVMPCIMLDGPLPRQSIFPKGAEYNYQVHVSMLKNMFCLKSGTYKVSVKYNNSLFFGETVFLLPVESDSVSVDID